MPSHVGSVHQLDAPSRHQLQWEAWWPPPATLNKDLVWKGVPWAMSSSLVGFLKLLLVIPCHSHLSFNTSLTLSLYQTFQCETPCTDRMTVHAMWKAKACEQTKNDWKCVNQWKSAISCLSRLQGQLQSCCTILVPLLHAGTWNQRRPFIYSNDSNVVYQAICLFHQRNRPMVQHAFVKQNMQNMFCSELLSVACLQQELHEFFMASFRCSKQSSRAWKRQHAERWPTSLLFGIFGMVKNLCMGLGLAPYL